MKFKKRTGLLILISCYVVCVALSYIIAYHFRKGCLFYSLLIQVKMLRRGRDSAGNENIPAKVPGRSTSANDGVGISQEKLNENSLKVIMKFLISRA